MSLVHVIDVINNELLEVYFIDKTTGERIDYSVEEFLSDIKQ